MKSIQAKKSSAGKGISRIWLGIAAVAGAAAAYLADPQRGGARREAAVRQVSGAAKSATELAGRWRGVVSARLARRDEGKRPEQVTLPTPSVEAATAKLPTITMPTPAESSSESTKPEA